VNGVRERRPRAVAELPLVGQRLDVRIERTGARELYGERASARPGRTTTRPKPPT
jgi:hypothetical protein